MAKYAGNRVVESLVIAQSGRHLYTKPLRGVKVDEGQTCLLLIGDDPDNAKKYMLYTKAPEIWRWKLDD